MTHKSTDVTTLAKWGFLATCVAIIYGSLFPFEFSTVAAAKQWTALASTAARVPGLGDILGNIILFVPFGYFVWHLPHNLRGLSLAVAWLIVALGAQLAQIFVPLRDASLFDLYPNLVGACIGWPLAKRFPLAQLASSAGRSTAQTLPLVIVVFWLASQLIPFVPTVDWKAYKEALKPLFLTPSWSMTDFLLEYSAWILVFYCVRFRLDRDIQLPLLAAIPIALCVAKVIVISNSLSLTTTTAVFLAAASWPILQERVIRKPYALGIALIVSYQLTALFPWTLADYSKSFSWVPFSGFLEGSMLTNSAALCEKLAVFTAVAWLLGNAKQFATRTTTLAVAASLFFTELLQTQLLAGSPEVTDALLYSSVAYAVHSLHNIKTIDADFATGDTSVAPGLQSRTLDNSGISHPYIGGLPGKRRSVAIAVASYCAVFLFATLFVLNQPGVPYNILELFRFGGNGFDIFCLSLAALSLGVGSAWLAAELTSTKQLFVRIPLALLKVTFVVYVLVLLAVTRESILDITGSTVFLEGVIQQELLGHWGFSLFNTMGPDNLNPLIEFLEPWVRFAALITPLLIFGAISMWFFTGISGGFSKGYSGKKVVAVLIFGLSCLYCSQVIVLDWASTDNLTELISAKGDHVFGGSLFLCLLVALIASSAAALAFTLSPERQLAVKMALLVTILLTVPLGWWLLNLGLEQQVRKYGLVFSGVDFLLGPDRETKLDSGALFARWAGVQIVITVGLCFGMTVFQRWHLAGSNALPEQDDYTEESSLAVQSLQVRDEAASDSAADAIRQPAIDAAVSGDTEILKLNLHLYQSNFLTLVEKRLGISPPLLCAELIAIAARRKHLEDSVLNEYRGSDVSYFKLRKKTGSWTRYELELDANAITDLDLLAQRTKETPSYTLRHLIDEHIAHLREQVRLRKMALSLWEAFVTFLWHQRKALAALVLAGLLILPFWLMSGGSPTVISAPEWAGRKGTIVFDGHSHTNFSDGSLSPAELVKLAVDGGCDALAITDHSDAKTTVDTRQLQEFATLRSMYPDFLLLGGVELNMPSYGGREHVNVIVDPSKESSVLPMLAALAENTSEDAQGDVALLTAIAKYRSQEVPLLAFYNHPSRKAGSAAEVTQNFLRWDPQGKVFNAIAGAPGHQNAKVLGSYREPELTVDHWDPAAASVGGVWDQLLTQGYNVGGAIASSDYHNDKLDKGPCAFSRIHVSVPEYSYKGLIQGMQAGTYWSDHDGILDALKLTLEIDGLETPVHPGSVIQLVETENTVLVSISLRRGKASINDPLTAEIISNCSTGRPEIVYEGVLVAEEAYHTGAFRVSNAESELESCFVRARVRLYYPLKDDLLAYTNPIRLLF
ncbi:VanZ family protein [Candidatus Litorirhabdus singularis]|nr:VanZ family protein [Candidatus Litorirhabdus singularis]